MCRLVAYLGQPVLLEKVVSNPVNSIIKQSLRARESKVPTNGDGFGLGWYAPEISAEPALFTSISPAWNDRNLLHLTARIRSPAFFAHVRAATMGGVTQYNCHPFIYGHWMMMHNGWIANFKKIKRHLRHLLDDDIYDWIKGESDTEHLFALFLQLSKGRNRSDLSVAADVLTETFNTIDELLKKFDAFDDSHYNVCLSDGKHILASRYCTDRTVEPETLHYAISGKFLGNETSKAVENESSELPNSILISSERLTNRSKDWEMVPSHHLLLVHSDLNVEYRAL